MVHKGNKKGCIVGKAIGATMAHSYICFNVWDGINHQFIWVVFGIAWLTLQVVIGTQIKDSSPLF